MRIFCILLAAGMLALGANVTEVLVPGVRVFPESITSTGDGTLIIGSLGLGSVFRAAPGTATAQEWIKPGTNGLNAVLGVLADEKSKTLWVCSASLDGKGENALKTFDLKTAAPKGSYPLPGTGPLCNDIAVGSDGTAYIADTRLARVLMLKPGAKALEVAADDKRLAGADGLAFGKKTELFVNSVTLGKLFRLDLGTDGKSSNITELTLSRPIERPDGMRSLGANRLLLAEGTGKMDVVTVDGGKATIETIKEGLESTPGVTATKGMAWVIEGKLNYRNDEKLKDKDPGTFKAYAVPLKK